MTRSTQHFALFGILIASEVVLGPSALLTKVDIESAYRLVPVHLDDRPLLGLRLGDKLYIDPMLPFRLRSASKSFTAVTDMLEW